MDIEGELGKLADTDIALVIADADDYVAVNKQILEHLVGGEGLAGIYVTVNKPYSTVVKTLEDAGIDTADIFFIDAISEDTGADIEDAPNVVFLESPQGLTSLSIAISEAVENLPEGRKFVFLDSLSTLAIYNDMDTVSQFAHFLTGKMRSWNVAGTIVSLESESDADLINAVSQFCDHVIRSP